MTDRVDAPRDGSLDPPSPTDRARERLDGTQLRDHDLRARIQQLGLRHRHLEKKLAAALRTDVSGLEVMDHLIALGPTTPSALASRLGTSTAAMSLVLNRLEDAGHISRTRHPDDGRKLIVTASGASTDQVWALISPQTEAVDRLIAGYTAEEQDLVEDFLDRVLAVYDEAERRLTDKSGHPGP
ncbi:MAG TPA: MarR family transcriptional regulator [Friedmanniella sp.]